MSFAFSSNTVATLEVTVTEIAEHAVRFSDAHGESFWWPRKALKENIQVGEKLTLELKKSTLDPFENLVKKAQQNFEEAKKHEQMRKLLEELIN